MAVQTMAVVRVDGSGDDGVGVRRLSVWVFVVNLGSYRWNPKSASRQTGYSNPGSRTT